MKRILSFLLVLSLLSALPLSVCAEEAEASCETFTVTADPGLPDNEELHTAYAFQALYSTSAAPLSDNAGHQLSGDLKVLYHALVPLLRQIAEGSRQDTVISVGKAFRYNGQLHTPDVAASFSGTGISESQLQQLIIALLSDLPYDMYWYDKTSGCSVDIFSGETMLCVKLKFTVAGNYASGAYTVNTDKTAAVTNAAANARHIVDCYADSSDYNKLVGYSDAICNLVNYNSAAASKGRFSEDNDPWQLIYVFDGNAGTKTVCEGYAKAYQYLCDLSSFQGNVQCCTVTGTVGKTLHMWNIVTYKDTNYLVDVTNTDSGSYDNRLLLAGCTGDLTSGYQVARITYRYDAATTAFWGTGSNSVLNLSKTACSPDWASKHTHSYSSWTTFLTATHARIGIKLRQCSKCGFVDSSCSSAQKMATPSLTLSNEPSTGYPRLTWKAVPGADVYRIYRSTSKAGTFSQIEATSSTEYTDTSAKTGKKYFYKVVAEDTLTGVCSSASSILNRVCDLPNPSVSVTLNEKTGKPVVEWETVEGAEKYYIYRSTSSGGSYTHLKSAVSARSYTDSSAKAGTTYYYKVKAIHKTSDATSAYSDAVRQICRLPQPAVVLKLNSSGDPYLSWKEISGAKGYEIFRSESADGEFISIGTRTALKFADKTAEEGMQYFYKIRALHKKSSASSIYSEVLEITLP